MELRQKFIKDRDNCGQSFESVSARRTVGELLQAAESLTQEQRRIKIEKRVRKKLAGKMKHLLRAQNMWKVSPPGKSRFGPRLKL